MPRGRQKHVISHLISDKIFYKKYTNRIVLRWSYFSKKKLSRFIDGHNLDHIMSHRSGSCTLYYMSDDHNKFIQFFKKNRYYDKIVSITTPLNLPTMTEMKSDRHLRLVKQIPFKKYRFKIEFKSMDRKITESWDFGFIKSQLELDTIRISWDLRSIIYGTPDRYWWNYHSYVYIEDEATMSMMCLIHSDIISKVYVYKTIEEMNNLEQTKATIIETQVK